MSNRAIIVVDIQNEYFPDGKLPLEGIETAVTNAAKVIKHARSAKDCVIHVRHEAADSNPPFFTPGTQGVAIHPMVAPLDSETVLAWILHQIARALACSLIPQSIFPYSTVHPGTALNRKNLCETNYLRDHHGT